MAQHGSDNRHWVSPHGSVAAKGVKSFELGEAQIGLFSKKSVEALADTKGLSNKEQLTLRYGDSNLSKNPSTIPFTLKDVKKVTIGLPKVAEQKTDYVRVGWDGINDETSFKFYKGDSWNLQVTVGGRPVSMFNASDKFTFSVPVAMEGPKFGLCLEDGKLCDLLPCQTKTIELVKDLRKNKFPTGQEFSELFDVYPIFSAPNNPRAGKKEYTQYCLEYCGFGDSNELANVSAQYPGKNVVRDEKTGKFVMLIPTDDGAPATYEKTIGSILKGCKDCPNGYNEIKGGFVYAVKVEDGGQDLTTKVQAIQNAVAGSAKKTGQDMGVGYYVVATSKKLTNEQIKTFSEKTGTTRTDTAGEHTHTISGGATATNAGNHSHTISGLETPSAEVLFLGTTEDTCENTKKETHNWLACGTCETFTAKYRVMVPDDCKGARLEELKKRYPSLNVVKKSTQNCISIYEGTVETDFSCSKGCNEDIVKQVFGSERPEPFSFTSHWYPVSEENQADDVKCGIEIKAKPFIVNPSECMEDDLPFIATSINILNVTGGYQESAFLGARTRNLVNVITLETAQDLDNLGGDLKGFEKSGNYYFTKQPQGGSYSERYFRGTQSLLDNLVQYVDVTLTVHSILPQNMNVATPKAMTYHVVVPFGKHKALEELFLSIASKADAEIEYI